MTIDKYIVNKRINCNVYGSNGELLIGIGTPISHSMLKHLKERTWYLEEPSDSLYDNIALLDDAFEPLVNPKVNSDKLFKKAKRIVDLILNNPVVFSNLKRIEEYDKYTYDHCNQVAYLAVAMGIRLGMETRDLINISMAALTHDIGKCMIDERIINKPGKLTDEEYNEVKKHSEFGYQIMKQNTELDEDVLNAIRYHHENYNGSGYPVGLKEEEIPTTSSIIHVCDVFDALVSKRPYKDGYSEYDSVNIIKKDRARMFNPNIVDIFCSSMQIYSVGSIIELEDGSKVEIIKVVKDEKGNVREVQFKELETEKVLVKKNAS